MYLFERNLNDHFGFRVKQCRFLMFLLILILPFSRKLFLVRNYSLGRSVYKPFVAEPHEH